MAQLLLDFVEARGAVHPREVEEHFARGTVRNDWGGSSHATTHMLRAMHYRGLLRLARRDRTASASTAHIEMCRNNQVRHAPPATDAHWYSPVQKLARSSPW